MIVIGDVHGCYKELCALLDILPQTNFLCFVGDLIDRGPDSKKVVDLVINREWKSVLGNHEVFLLDAVIDRPHVADVWISNGGDNTLKSYGFKIDPDHVDWIKQLPLVIEYKNYIISHSYCFKGADEEDILWERGFANPVEAGKKNIFGHTIHRDGPKTYHNKHICIDTGCFITGILTAIDLETEKIYQTKGE